jgi:hypothetical protein
LEPTSELAQFWSIAFQDVRTAAVGPLTSDSRPRIPSVSLQCPTAVGINPWKPEAPVKPGRNPISSSSFSSAFPTTWWSAPRREAVYTATRPGRQPLFSVCVSVQTSGPFRIRGRFVTRPTQAVNPLFSLRFSVQPEDRSASGGGL